MIARVDGPMNSTGPTDTDHELEVILTPEA